MKATIPIFFLMLLVMANIAPAQSTRPATQPAAKLVWHRSLDAGYAQSQRSQLPILVVAVDALGARSRLMLESLNHDTMQPVLQRLVLVELTGELAEERRSLGIAVVPALRVLDASGHVVARSDDLLPPNQLAEWLASADKQARQAMAGLAISDVPGLVARLSMQNAVARESAIRQLQSTPQTAAQPVIQLLSSTDLTGRISAADLLEGWGAPVEDIDPWDPKTLTPEKLQTLRAWATALKSTPTTAPTTAPTTQSISESASLEIDLLLAASTAAEARGVRERLVRFGDSILPEVYRRLQSPMSDVARARLKALRYRLVAQDEAADDVANALPGVFDQLAAPDAPTRRAAVDVLFGVAKPSDTRLVLELFSDDDPLIRERALRTLKSLGGAEAQNAIVRLLADPSPNVRAAVLKTLAEGTKDASLVPELAKYVLNETDSDLVVHAVHVLKELRGETAVQCLQQLLTHAEWRVRAEAIDALGAQVQQHSGPPLAEPVRAKAYVAMMKLLDDEEPFVVSRVVAALIGSKYQAAIEPVLKAIERRPEFGAEVLKVISHDESMSRVAGDKMKGLLRHERADIRAGAVAIMAVASPVSAGEAIEQAIVDPDPVVRAAACKSAVAALKGLRPKNGRVERSGFLGFGKTSEQVNPADWLNEFRAGKGRPKWVENIQPHAQAIATGPWSEAQLDAGIILCAVGQDEQAMPMLRAVAASEHSRLAARALPWLGIESRLALFAELIKQNDQATTEYAIQELMDVPDPQAATVLWDAVQTESTLDSGYEAVRKLYFGERYWNISEVPASQKKKARDEATRMAETGNEFQRDLAMAVLLILGNDDAGAAAQKILDDPKTPPSLYRDAVQIRLLTLPEPEANKLAIRELSSDKAPQVSIRYLAGGTDAITQLRRGVYLQTSTVHYSSSIEERYVAKVPAGVTLELVKAVDVGQDKTLAGYAGYLRILLGDAEGFAALENAWRTDGNIKYSSWTPLMYRAIAKLNDESKVALLEEIYASLDKHDYHMKEFYWTIRPLTGERVLKLRKKIRDEVGMQQLQ